MLCFLWLLKLPCSVFVLCRCISMRSPPSVFPSGFRHSTCLERNLQVRRHVKQLLRFREDRLSLIGCFDRGVNMCMFEFGLVPMCIPCQVFQSEALRRARVSVKKRQNLAPREKLWIQRLACDNSRLYICLRACLCLPGIWLKSS